MRLLKQSGARICHRRLAMRSQYAHFCLRQPQTQQQDTMHFCFWTGFGGLQRLTEKDWPLLVWAMLSAGHKAIAIPSATLFNKKEFKSELLAAHVPEGGNTLHIYPDKDKAGENLYNEILSASVEIGFHLVRHELPDGCKDFADYWTWQSVHRTPSPAKNK